MKTILEIKDSYNDTTSSIRVTPIHIDGEQDQIQLGHTHYCNLTENQINKLNRELPNGPEGLNITQIDQMTGKPISGEIMFDL